MITRSSGDVQEGNDNRIWVRERYDWSTPATVRWTVPESSLSTTGDFVETVVTPERPVAAVST